MALRAMNLRVRRVCLSNGGGARALIGFSSCALLSHLIINVPSIIVFFTIRHKPVVKKFHEPAVGVVENLHEPGDGVVEGLQKPAIVVVDGLHKPGVAAVDEAAGHHRRAGAGYNSALRRVAGKDPFPVAVAEVDQHIQAAAADTSRRTYFKSRFVFFVVFSPFGVNLIPALYNQTQFSLD